jgi:single-strand DNA-binding protein
MATSVTMSSKVGFMASYNKVLLMGNLTRDPQLKYTPAQMAICEFGLAVNRKWKSQSGEQKEEVNFIDCTAWGRTGEVINQYFTKGKPIFIEGRLKYDSWEDKQGGGKRSKVTVVVENFQFIGGKDGGAGGGGQGGDYSEEGSQERAPARPPQRGRGAAPQAPQEAPFGEEKQFSDDDIPF